MLVGSGASQVSLTEAVARMGRVLGAPWLAEWRAGGVGGLRYVHAGPAQRTRALRGARRRWSAVVLLAHEAGPSRRPYFDRRVPTGSPCGAPLGQTAHSRHLSFNVTPARQAQGPRCTRSVVGRPRPVGATTLPRRRWALLLPRQCRPRVEARERWTEPV